MDTAIASDQTTVADRPALGVAPVQVPSVGRIIHVEGPRGECLAAIVTTEVDPEKGTAAVTVFPPDVLPVISEIEVGRLGWHWPERVG